jgi:site-specific recombinase XerD
MSDLVSAWLHWLEHDKQRAANTVRTYARTMRTLQCDPAHATVDDLSAWWATRTHLSPATRSNELAAVTSFYTWAIKWDHRPDNPARRLEAPKIAHTLPRPVPRHELIHMLDTFPPDLVRAVALGAYAGLRIHEAAALSWHDIDQEARRMVVLGKGAKERRVGVPPLLLDYLLPDTSANVVTGTRKAHSYQALTVRINRWMKQAHLERYRATSPDGDIADAGPAHTYHDLRKRYATKAAESGVGIKSIAASLGHASLATTAIYVESADADLDLIAMAACR